MSGFNMILLLLDICLMSEVFYMHVKMLSSGGTDLELLDDLLSLFLLKSPDFVSGFTVNSGP